MPRKPTKPFGTIKFSKDGRVTKEVQKLSTDRELQQAEVAATFVQQLEKFGRTLDEPMPLPERDHDFLTSENGKQVYVQLTELVDRTFAKPLEAGALLIDDAALDEALQSLIQTKLNKHYAKSDKKSLWLVVFTTSMYPTECWQGGERKVSEGLKRARALLETINHPFDEVWFTNLITNPIKIWPMPAIASS